MRRNLKWRGAFSSAEDASHLVGPRRKSWQILKLEPRKYNFCDLDGHFLAAVFVIAKFDNSTAQERRKKLHLRQKVGGGARSLLPTLALMLGGTHLRTGAVNDILLLARFL